MYEIIGYPATRALRVIWMCEEIGVPYEVIPEKPHSDLMRAINPTGKVPALRVGTDEEFDIITDSSAILTYLADKHGALTAPAGTIARAQQDAMTHRILDEIEALLWAGARHSFILPEEHRVPEVKPAMKREFAHNLAKLSETIAGPFVMGDEMTVPDIILAHNLNWAFSAKFPLEDAKMNTYAKSMRARPAYKRATGKPA